MKKAVSILVCAALSVSALSGCSFSRSSDSYNSQTSKESTTSSDMAQREIPEGNGDGKVLNVYCWDEEFKSRFEDYYEKAGRLKNCGLERVNFQVCTITGDYTKNLNKLLETQDTAAADKKIDLFLVGGDDIQNYMDSKYALDIIGDVGVSESELAEQYEYTRDIAKDSSGIQRASSWSAAPGVFVYRRSIALDVLGTDEPSAVQEVVADWDKFASTAKIASEKGYKMVSGTGDMFEPYTAGRKKSWVSDEKLRVDSSLLSWADGAYNFSKNKYTNGNSMWSDKWLEDMKTSGKVFGFFLPPWAIEYVMPQYAAETSVEDGGKEASGNGAYGDYAVCKGPKSFYSGGAWLCVAKGSDNLVVAKDIIKTMTCDSNTMLQMAKETGDFVNNVYAMEELAKDKSYSRAFLGGQNPVSVYNTAAKSLTANPATKFDAAFATLFQAAMADYFNGSVQETDAINAFYKAVKKRYSSLSVPNAASITLTLQNGATDDEKDYEEDDKEDEEVTTRYEQQYTNPDSLYNDNTGYEQQLPNQTNTNENEGITDTTTNTPTPSSTDTTSTDNNTSTDTSESTSNDSSSSDGLPYGGNNESSGENHSGPSEDSSSSDHREEPAPFDSSESSGEDNNNNNSSPSEEYGNSVIDEGSGYQDDYGDDYTDSYEDEGSGATTHDSGETNPFSDE